MTVTLTERETRLPKWARDELASLRRMVTEAEAAAEEARLATSPDESDTVIERFGHKAIGLGAGQAVTFKLAEHGTVQARVEYDRRGGYLEVLASSTGEITIEPRSGNVFRVRVSR